VHRKQQVSGSYEYKYTYNKIHHGFNPDDVLIDGAIINYDEGNKKLFYRYPGKAPVMLRKDTVKVHRQYSQWEGEAQAYYLLSQLESAGNVTGWREV